MKPGLKSNLRLIVVLMTLCHIATSCTRKLHPLPEYQKAGINDATNGNAPADQTEINRSERIEKQSRKGLQQFRESATADKINETKTLADEVLYTARRYLGVPYCFGGITERCLDCSGFVRIVFDEYGIDLPHSAQEQSKTGTIIRNKKDLVKGDLLFFNGSYKTSNHITHSAIYTGDNAFIHASTGKGVTITSLDDPWWKGKLSFGTRILNLQIP